ncbi:hypothetical protein I0P11_14365 [Acinetobacter baumannii]|uniref:hypothetical protein n=1 Tax=Acinetobacter baumannii TaxID=470 RepID=UPI0018AF7E2F|nr:hypothetical protein [Acinetobacter baumannii]MBF9262293.1 hypothetical protein [Acinetobacter baumannii]MBO0660847.1 hypothetical protein [Acinetobacter baumannii]MDE3319614.1 hypothetical protein [Acinetobacter baumannii]MDX5549674.1 hypothetical protein [Acinetobacter baumannii]
MTVQQIVPYAKYVTNGADSVYTVNFFIEDKENLFIKLNDVVVSMNDYNYLKDVNGIEFHTPLLANQKLEIFRKTKLERTTNFESFNNTFRPEVLNKDLDKIWLTLQEQSSKVDQYDLDYEYAVRTSSQALTEVKDAQARADDAYELADLTNTEIRPILRGGTGANNASDARNNLDVHSKAEVLALVQTGGAGEVLSIESGGTGGMTVEAARANLDVYSKSEVASRVGLPIGNIRWFNGSRSQIEDGEIALDGTTVLKRADYPELWAYIQAYQHVITDAEWVATPLKRSAFSSGDGSTTFRLADMNGKYTNSLRSPVLRGDGYYPSGIALGDAIREIEGHTNYMSYVDSPESQFEGKPSLSGAFYAGAVKGYTVQGAAWANPNSGNSQKPLAFKASLVVPTANENRPNSIFGVYVIKAMGVTQAKPNEGQYPTLTGGNTWNGGQSMTDLTVSGGFNANIKPLLNATGSLPIYALRTWGVIKGTSNPASLVTGVNVASVIDDGIGQYRIVFSTPMPTLNYAILIGTTTYSEADKGTYGAVRMNTKTLNGFSILCGGQSTADIPEISFGVILP